MRKRIIVTGGAGFVGSNIALKLKEKYENSDILALDNLRRRGSELSLERLKRGGVRFIHGDIRNVEDIDKTGVFDILIECSAEPSVKAGYDGDPRYLTNTNLLGTLNCLECARKWRAGIIFISTSRVYPIKAMRMLPFVEGKGRYGIPLEKKGQGWSSEGIDADFPLTGSRSIYGATKLCSELMLQEYSEMYKLPSVINRCSVIAGPWQMGKVDQGFVTHWAARHLFSGELCYTGFGGRGLQVRDILHIDDLFNLIHLQIDSLDTYRGGVFNVGGGLQRSVSLLELTQLCLKLSGKRMKIKAFPETHPADIPYYVTDNRAITVHSGWRPEKSVEDTLGDIFAWLENNAAKLRKRFT